MGGGVFFAKLASNKPRGITHQLIHPPSQSTPRSGMLFILPEFGPLVPMAGWRVEEFERLCFFLICLDWGLGLLCPPPSTSVAEERNSNVLALFFFYLSFYSKDCTGNVEGKCQDEKVARSNSQGTVGSNRGVGIHA